VERETNNVKPGLPHAGDGGPETVDGSRQVEANCQLPIANCASDVERETSNVERCLDARASRRFGVAQVWAALLLLVFCAQGLWLLLRAPLGDAEVEYLHPPEMSGRLVSPAMASPVTTLAARAASVDINLPATSRLPFLLVGVLLGASVWYIARRLYGNAGGFVALTLYAFSPSMIICSARVQPEIIAAWGMFGCVFTAIAVAHTLYAPHNLIRWNWKRIALLSLAIGVGTGAHFFTVLAILFGLAFMLYLAPGRRGTTLGIAAASTAIGLAIFAAMHGFRMSAILASARDAGGFSPAALASSPAGPSHFGGFTLRMLAAPSVWRMLGVLLLHNSPGFVLLLALSVVTLAVWRRTRFFGNLAPLLIAAALIGLGLVFPYAAGFTFVMSALPFLFVFTAGVCADLLESRRAPLALGIISGALVMHAYFSISGLWRL